MGVYSENLLLFNGETSDGNGDEQTAHYPGVWLIYASGTFDGATVKLQYKPPGHASFLDVPGALFTAAGVLEVRVSAAEQLRGNISGAGGSTSITLSVDYSDSR